MMVAIIIFAAVSLCVVCAGTANRAADRGPASGFPFPFATVTPPDVTQAIDLQTMTAAAVVG